VAISPIHRPLQRSLGGGREAFGIGKGDCTGHGDGARVSWKGLDSGEDQAPCRSWVALCHGEARAGCQGGGMGWKPLGLGPGDSSCAEVLCVQVQVDLQSGCLRDGAGQTLCVALAKDPTHGTRAVDVHPASGTEQSVQISQSTFSVACVGAQLGPHRPRVRAVRPPCQDLVKECECCVTLAVAVLVHCLGNQHHGVEAKTSSERAELDSVARATEDPGDEVWGSGLPAGRQANWIGGLAPFLGQLDLEAGDHGVWQRCPGRLQCRGCILESARAQQRLLKGCLAIKGSGVDADGLLGSRPRQREVLGSEG
jgi:hypothetical protein